MTEAETIIEFVNMHERLVCRAWAFRPDRLKNTPRPPNVRLRDLGFAMIEVAWREHDEDGSTFESFNIQAELLTWSDARIQEWVAARDAEEESLNRSREAARAARIDGIERAEYERLRQKFDPVIVEDDKVTVRVPYAPLTGSPARPFTRDEIAEAAHFMDAPPSFAPGLSGGEIALDWIKRNELKAPPHRCPPPTHSY